MTKKREVEPAVDYRSVKRLSKKFPALVKEQAELKAMLKTLETRADEIKDLLAPMMIVAHAKHIQVDDPLDPEISYRSSLCHGKNTRIDAMRLLNKGVKSDVIKASTVVKEYDWRDLVLYALGGGAGFDELEYVYEEHFGPTTKVLGVTAGSPKAVYTDAARQGGRGGRLRCYRILLHGSRCGSPHICAVDTDA